MCAERPSGGMEIGYDFMIVPRLLIGAENLDRSIDCGL
jgi:hypothetical protein